MTEPWVYDVVMTLQKWHDEHPRLYGEYFDVVTSAFVTKRTDACGCEALDHVPAEVKAQARILADYLQHRRQERPDGEAGQPEPSQPSTSTERSHDEQDQGSDDEQQAQHVPAIPDREGR